MSSRIFEIESSGGLPALPGRTWRMLTLAINDTCPLRCRHCSIGYSDEYPGTRRTLSAEDIVETIEHLNVDVYDAVCFAGGEPSVSLKLLEVGINACQARGLQAGMVTAPVWARTPEAAERYLDRLPPFDLFVLSLDKYHLEFLTLAHYENVLNVAETQSIRVVLLSCVASPEEEAGLVAKTRHLRDRAFHTFQPVLPIGNALQVSTRKTTLSHAASLRSLPRSCSVPFNAVVAIDKDVRACCWAACEEDSPLRYSSEGEGGIPAAVRAVDADPTVRRLRVSGLVDALGEEGQEAVVDALGGRSFVNECHLCIELMSPEHRELWEKYVAPASRDSRSPPSQSSVSESHA